MTATCTTCGDARTFTSVRDASSWLWTHDLTAHRGQQPEIVQMPGPDWHERAMQAVLALARSGRPFVISEVITYGVPDAPNPRTDWSRIQREAEGLGLITQTGRLGRSVRPTTKGSPVAEWVGTAKATGAAA